MTEEERQRKHMSITLPTPLQDWVEYKVDSGMYHSYSEVVREALRLMISAEARDERRGDE